MMAFMAMQYKMMAKAMKGDDSFFLDDEDALPEGGKAFRDYQKHEKLLKENPVEFVRVWYNSSRKELGVHPGDVSNPDVYMKSTIADRLGEHTTLWRMLKMQIEVERLFSEGKSAHARAQNLANYRATHRAVTQGGHWRGAWQFSYLPDLHEVESGTTMAERLAVGKYLKETAALEELLEKEKTRDKKKK